MRRHFRELGHDIERKPFTVVGIGDMSGDVFGNGMLRSDQIRLVGAFDHRHVFLDPTPDTARSFAERQRLFELGARHVVGRLRPGRDLAGRRRLLAHREVDRRCRPRCAPRSASSAAALTPAELCQAILRAPVDLLWNGGIGTFVKATDESHDEVGDRANDAIRVDGRELRARVVGEGGNLGVTQAGRIEYALAGGHINTDAIDNSAGVDCSDHEVNLKILLDLAVERGHAGARGARPAARRAAPTTCAPRCSTTTTCRCRS